MFYDMSTQKQTMQALQQSEARTRALIQAFPDMVVELDVDGKIANIVPRRRWRVSFLRNDLLGKIFRISSRRLLQPRRFFPCDESIESDQMNAFEFEMEMGGIWRTMEARLVASASDTALMLIRDVTQRKWIEG